MTLTPLDHLTHITRVRYGLATNSSSSHSMVTLPSTKKVSELLPETPYCYDNGYRLSTEQSKRHYLAGALRTQSPSLWGQSVLIEAEQKESDGENTTSREAWDSTPAPKDSYGYYHKLQINLPRWLTEEINALCGLPADTDLSQHKTDNSFGWPFTIPRKKDGMGPDPVAWAAICAAILDPQTVVYAPEENGWDDEIDSDQHQQISISKEVARRTGKSKELAQHWEQRLTKTPRDISKLHTFASKNRYMVVVRWKGEQPQVTFDPYLHEMEDELQEEFRDMYGYGVLEIK